MRKFHQHQDDANRATGQLVMALLALVLAIVLLSGTVVAYVFALLITLDLVDPTTHPHILWATFGITVAVCTCIVTIGSALKTMDLAAGGKVVAKDLGGTLVDKPEDPATVRLMNVVEEMSIASGVHVPPVYILESPGINAFAAGYELKDAVLGVTRGAVDNLTREQLQGVIAHEFSHIFNGDMKLNMRMLGLMHGVLCISILAKKTMETGFDALGRSRAWQGAILMIAIGGALWMVGIAGTAVSLLVKAATSRQREFLADAYAVQFTRNPEGLAGAMKIIAGHQTGSRVNGPKTLEASHMFFAEGCGRLASMMASHPPISNRILRLDPTWDGVPYYVDDQREIGQYTGAFSGALGLVSGGARQISGANEITADDSAAVSHASAANGLEEYDHTWQVAEVAEVAASEEYIVEQQSGLSDRIVEFIQLPVATPFVLSALWASHAKTTQSVAELWGPTDGPRVQGLVKAFGGLNEAQQMMLFDDAISRLASLPAEDLNRTREIYQRISPVAEELNVFHWMWNSVLENSLQPDSDGTRRSRYGRLDQVAGACEFVLSTVCHTGADQEMVAGFAFQRALASLGVSNVSLLPEQDCTWDNFQTAVDVIRQLSASPRRQLLVACTNALTSDREITASESQMIRGICAKWDFEVPSILPGQPLAAGV